MWFSFFLVFLFIIPYSFALNPVPNVDLPVIRVLIPLLFIVWLLEGILQKQLLLDARMRTLALLLFVFLASLSLFWAIEPSFGYRKIIYFLSFLPLYFVGYAASTQRARRNKILAVLTYSGFLLGIFAIIQFLLQFVFGIDQALQIIKLYVPFFLGDSFSNLVFAYPSWLVNVAGQTLVRAFASFPDPHLFSLYINMLVPLALFLLFKTSKRRYLLFAATMLIAGLLSFSRAAYFSLSAAIVFFFISSHGFNFVRKKFALVLFLFLIFILAALIPNPLTSRFFSSFSAQEGSNSGRIAMWAQAWQIIEEHPFSGVGLGNFAYYLDPTIELRNPVYAHNIFLDFGSELGIFAIFLLFMLILSPIASYYSRPTKLKFALATCFVVFFVHSLFETPFYSIRAFSLFIVLLSFESNG